MRDRWVGSWSTASLWLAVPVVYLGPVLAAAAADSARVRATSGLPAVQEVAARARWQVEAAHLLALVVVGAVVPVKVVAAVVVTVAAATSRWGRWDGTWLLVCLLWSVGMVGLGRFTVVLTRSPVGAPLVALVLGLVVSVYGAPIPPSTSAWLEPNPMLVWSVAGVVVAWLVAGQLVVALRTSRAPVRVLRVGGAGLLVAVSFVAVLAGLRLIDRQVPRSTTSAGRCAPTPAGSTVCVWPQDARFLSPLVAQVTRLDELTSAIDAGQRWWVAEPGLVVHRSAASTVRVESLSLGDGMWLTAQTLSYQLPVLAGAQCYNPGLTAAAQHAVSVSTWAALDLASSHIFGASRPATVHFAPDEVSKASDALVTSMMSLDGSGRAAWIAQTWATVKAQECAA